MNEPIIIAIGTTPILLVGLACMVLVTVLAVLDYRRRGRLVADARRALDTLPRDYGAECVNLARDWADTHRATGGTDA